MKLYDTQIKQSLSLLEGLPKPKLLAREDWPEAGAQNLILRSEMAYELGGANLPALSALFLSSTQEELNSDEVWLYGPDLNEIKIDAAYARLTLLKVADEGLGDKDSLYSAIRKIEYSRYHIQPKGYMMRISAANGREPVRISSKDLKEGLSFSKVGEHYIKAYKKHKEVLAVKVIFITLSDFPYSDLNTIISQGEKITNSLDLLSKNLKMDCTVCKLKPVCDEVEGMKELHFSQK